MGVTVADGGFVEISGGRAQAVVFAGSSGTLKLDHSVAFGGVVSGLTGADALDLADMKFGSSTKAAYSGTSAGGTLTVSDGTHTAHIALSGNYLSSGWTLSSDGNGGTVVVDPLVNTDWKQLHIGAGGWLTGIDIAPDDTMVVRTDTYGAYLWNGSQWQQLVTATSMPAEDVAIGHNEGVYEIRVAPSDSHVFYMEYLGNVYRSSDRGTTWSKTAFSHVVENPNDGYRMNGQKMAVDPHNPNVVYVGTPQNGMFVTTDGGQSWQAVSGLPVSGQDSTGQYPGITGIAFDPNSAVSGGKTSVIYASSYGHGVYESTNGGQTWSALSAGPSAVTYATMSTTGVYYAIGSDTTLWRYMNGAWTHLNAAPSSLHTVMSDPFNPAHLVVSTDGGSLAESLDGGATWGDGNNWSNQLSATDVPWLATTGQYMCIGGMVFDPLVQNKLWAADGVGVWHTDLPQNFSWNTPIVWNSQSAGIEQLVANDILVAPGGHPVLASWDRPFFYVSNPDTYPSSYEFPGQASFAAGWSVDYASSQPNFLVGLADWWGVEESGYSSDGGQSWHLFPSFPSFAGKTIGGTIAASSPTDIVWAPADGYAPYYTKDGGVTWNQVTLPGVSDWSGFHFAYYLDKTTVTADRVLPNTFYLYYNGVYKSTDGGATWTQVHSGEISAFSGYNSHIETVPGEAGNLFFTGGPQGVATHPAGEGFYQSSDGGATWTAVPNVLEVSCFGFGKAATDGGYPSIYIVGYVNNVYGVWESDDHAQSWTQIGDWPTGSLDQIKTISGDPNIYGRVYVGFEGSGYAYVDSAGSVSPLPPPDTSSTVVITEGLVSDTGSSSTDQITSNPTLSGLATANTTITVKEGATVLGMTVADANGAWTFTPALADGVHTITTIATSASGTSASASVTFTLDTIAPNVAVATAALTGSGKATLTGTADISGAISIWDGTTLIGTTTASNGAWSFTTPMRLTNTVHTFHAVATDIAGNSGAGTGVLGTISADNLVGNAGQNIINGRGGGDSITGGGGNDRFVYNSASDSTPLNFDKINDFVHARDKFDFTNINGITATNGVPLFQGNVTGTGTQKLAPHSIAYLEVGTNTEVVVNTSKWAEYVSVSDVSAANMEIVLKGVGLGLTSLDFLHA